MPGNPDFARPANRRPKAHVEAGPAVLTGVGMVVLCTGRPVAQRTIPEPCEILLILTAGHLERPGVAIELGTSARLQSTENRMKLIGLFRTAQQLCSRDPNTRKKGRYLLAAKVHGIDLNGVSLEQLGLDPARSRDYSDSGPDLEQVLQSLDISASDAALDLGCGKGGAMITMAKYFPRVDGVEISPQLAQTARNNLRRAHLLHSDVYCADATEFTDLDRYTVLYMFNPFTEPVVAHALANLRESLERRPRPMRLIYRNPVCDAAVTAAGFRRAATLKIGTQPVHIYDRQWIDSRRPVPAATDAEAKAEASAGQDDGAG